MYLPDAIILLSRYSINYNNTRISRAKRRVIYGGYWKGETSESRTPRTDLV